MDILLTPDMERQIAEKVHAGFYSDPSEVVREALRLLFEADKQRRYRLEADIQVGFDQADRGEVVDGEESRRRLEARFAG